MRKLAIWTALVVAISGAAAFYFFRDTAPDPGPILAAMNAANYCKEDAECKVTGGDCPFSSELVNEKELAKLNQMFHGYYAAGGRRCIANEFEDRDFSRIACERGKCVAARKAQSRDGAKGAPLQQWR